ncbi:BlaI/MecI/CopY family transcriptional regulator [Streptomyces sp. NPDC005813]|uniref:BlaI/MecI/CopY family transcriptional regulator n=1 Tax=Streptomyces sp. NPDC005813 TaxID=3155592 RepID=UPI0033F00EB5
MSVEADVQEPLSNVYTHRVRADLERVETAIAQTEARLKALRSDHVLLSRLWENLADAAEVTDTGATAPGHRYSEPEASGKSRARSRSLAAGAGLRAPAAKRGSVRDAVLKHLRASEHSVSVNDIFAALPSKVQRSGKVVVRNTVEALVAKGAVERSREGQFVRYTLVAASSEADA